MVEAPPSLIDSPTEDILTPSPDSAIPVPAPQLPSTAAGTELRQLGILTPDSLDSLCAEESKRPFVVEGFLSAGSIGWLSRTMPTTSAGHRRRRTPTFATRSTLSVITRSSGGSRSPRLPVTGIACPCRGRAIRSLTTTIMRSCSRR